MADEVEGVLIESESEPAGNPAGFFLACAVIATATALCWCGKVSGAEWVSAVTWITAVVLLGKAVHAVAGGMATLGTAKATEALTRAKAMRS